MFNPATLTAFGDLISHQGGWGLSVVLMAIIGYQWRVNREDMRIAHDAERAALRENIPMQKQLAQAVTVLEAKNRRRATPSAPSEPRSPP